MKRLILACLLAASSHGFAADLDPECYRLYDMFTKMDSRATIARSNIAGEMMDRQCWPALQGIPGAPADTQPVTSCDALVPYIMQMANRDKEQLLKVHNPKPMTYAVIDQVAENLPLRTYTDNKGRSARVRQPLKSGNMTYRPGKGYLELVAPGAGDNGTSTRWLGKDVLIVPDSAPFAAYPPTGTQRVLDCSGEGRHTSGMWWIQMTMDRDSDGDDFVGLYWLAEMR